MRIEKFIENIPEWAMVYLFNNDRQGLTEEEIRMVDDFKKSYETENVRVNFDCLSIDPFFTWFPAFGEAGNCYEVEVILLIS